MDSVKRVESSQTYFDYDAIKKATVTSVALMALSVVAMKGIQHSAKRTITPLQRNIAGVVLTAVYMAAVAHLHGPFTRKDDSLPPSSDERKPPEVVVPPPRERSPQRGLFQGDPYLASKLPTQEGSIDLDWQQPRRDRSHSERPLLNLGREPGSLRQVSELHPPLNSSGGVVAIPSGSQVQEESRNILVNLNRLGVHGPLAPQPVASRDSDSLAVVLQPIEANHRRQPPLLGLQNPMDLTRIDPRQILFALESFRDAILTRGSLLIECNVPLQGRIVVVRADTSTHEKQLEALHGCDLLRALIMGGRRQALGFVEQAVVELPHSEISGQKKVLRVEASRPATHLEDEDLILVDNPGYADAEIPKNLPPPSVEEILHLKEPREQVRRIYNYYKDDLKEREQVAALRDLLLGCYKSHPKHHQLVLAVSQKLLEKKLIPFSGNPFHEFWSPLLFEVKELRRGFSYVTMARKDKTSSTLTDLFYLRQLNTHGQSQRLTDCFLEDLEQKKQQHDKVIRIKRLGQLLISSKYAKNSRFNENFEHSMLFAVLMNSDLSKGSVNWLFNRNDQAEFLGEVLDFFELHAFLRPFGGLRNLKQCMLKRAAATYFQKGHRSEEVLTELKGVHLLTDSETVNYFFSAENSGTDLDIFTIYHNYPDLFEADLAPNFMMNVLRNTLEILEAEKEQEGREYLASDPQARIFVQLLPNKFFSHPKQSQSVAFILNHFLAEFPHYFVHQLFDGHPDGKAFLSHHMNLIPSHVAVNMEGVCPHLHREFKEGLLSEVFAILAELKSDHDLRQLDRILQSKILPMLQCEGSLHTLIEEYSDGGGQFDENLRKMTFHQEQE